MWHPPAAQGGEFIFAVLTPALMLGRAAGVQMSFLLSVFLMLAQVPRED